MVETQLLQPTGVRLVGQQRVDMSGSGEIYGLQCTPNVQLETDQLTSMHQKSEAAALSGSQNIVGMATPFWQRKVSELGPEDFCNLRSMLGAQKEKIHQQLQELQKVVVSQCRITQTNPLAQEMAAAVLEKRIGKRFGESLSPKALKCLYNVFSIKDTITKKEAREISALCGATVTQVREFFAGQRSRVRKVVQCSHIDRGSEDMLVKVQSTVLDQSTIEMPHAEDTSSLFAQQVDSGSRQCNHLLLLDAYCGREDGILTKQHALEKAEHLINVMHKEDTFTGQSQLAQVIMQAHESVLRCFMARGGLQLINRWLSQAAAEEQTSLIRLLLKTVTQLPLGSALPRHMSLLLQTVNKLRFYRAQDIASRSRLLLSRWSRFFKNSQSGKMASLAGLARTTQPGQKRNRDSTHSHVLEDACKKKVKADTLVGLVESSDLASSSLTEDKTVPQRDKPEAVTEINKKRLGSFLNQGDRAKEKRKVQLFEGSQVATRRKDVEGTRCPSFEPSSRPLSADDIKKAKRRAYFLGKSQKPSSPRLDESVASDLWLFSAEREQRKSFKSIGSTGPVRNPSMGDNSLGGTVTSMEGRPVSQLSSSLTVSDVLVGQRADFSSLMSGKTFGIVNLPDQIAEGHKVIDGEVTSGLCSVVSSSMKQREAEVTDAMEMPSILWTTPPRVSLDPQWKTASGEHSTEVVQETNRLKNEVEAIYLSPQFIPSSPVEPAERFCLFVDDASVPEILLEAVEEESLEKDFFLQSPRDDAAKPRKEDSDSQKLIANMDSKAQGEVLLLGRENLDRPVALETPLSKLMGTGDQQRSLLIESTEMNHLQSLTSAATDPAKNLHVNPSELTLATPLKQMHKESGISGYGNSEVYKQHRGVHCSQIENCEAIPISKEQHPLPLCNAALDELSLNSEGRKDISTSNQNHCEETTTSLTGNKKKVPSLLDHFTMAGAGNTITAVDLSDLTKEDCMDMLNIVLQQLTDNAKASGADLELLSVFLKNPQLVYTLMSSHVGPSGKGSSSVSSGMHLMEVTARSTIGDINSQLEKLTGRDMATVPNTASTLEKSPHSSQFVEPVRRLIPPTNPHLHSPLSPRTLQVIDQQVQLPHKESKGFDGKQFLKHPSSTGDISSSSADYDWSQPYDYPANCMQQGAVADQELMDASIVVDICPRVSSYSQTPPGYSQPHFTRAARSQNPSVSLAQTDARSHSSMLKYDGGHANMNATTLYVERDEKVVKRGNGFPVMDELDARLLQSGAVISDGLLPVPGIAFNNLRAHSSISPHDTHPLRGGKVPSFVPEARGTNHVVRNHMPPYVGSGHNYSNQSFRPEPALDSCPPVVPHAQPPPSFLTNSMSPLWRSPRSRSNFSRHARPGWREI